MKNILFPILFLFFFNQAQAQHYSATIEAAAKKGIFIKSLDSIYQSAVHSDTSLAVFKTDEEQKLLNTAYTKLLQDFGHFLKSNNFIWLKDTRCWNRIYFNADGSIDYFLYHFTGTAEVQPPISMQVEFDRLLNIFIQDYNIQITAKVKFAQCSTVTYTPK